MLVVSRRATHKEELGEKGTAHAGGCARREARPEAWAARLLLLRRRRRIAVVVLLLGLGLVVLSPEELAQADTTDGAERSVRLPPALAVGRVTGSTGVAVEVRRCLPATCGAGGGLPCDSRGVGRRVDVVERVVVAVPLLEPGC